MAAKNLGLLLIHFGPIRLKYTAPGRLDTPNSKINGSYHIDSTASSFSLCLKIGGNIPYIPYTHCRILLAATLKKCMDASVPIPLPISWDLVADM